MSREKICSDPAEIPPFILLCSIEGLSLWVCKFILEIRRKDGQCYPPNTLYGIVCGLMRKLRNVDASIDFFKDARFSSIYKTLDGEMKRLCTLRVGVMQKQAEPITVAKEDILWNKGLLGDHNPRVLLNTIVYLCGVSFTLRLGYTVQHVAR